MFPALVLVLLAQSAASIQLPGPLDRVLRDYEKAWRAKDAKALAELFTPNGWVLQSQSPFAQGPAAIEKQYQGQGGALFLRAVASESSGDLAYILGAYTYDAATNPDRGKFTLVLKKDASGRWRILSDMDNSIR
ncbi:MAG: nuclear transport factor 2 family protein [Bryobacteraceae bacterium]|nr:nuclear transport factor 2 family protein [Bryobacteraceae bacterium]